MPTTFDAPRAGAPSSYAKGGGRSVLAWPGDLLGIGDVLRRKRTSTSPASLIHESGLFVIERNRSTGEAGPLQRTASRQDLPRERASSYRHPESAVPARRGGGRGGGAPTSTDPATYPLRVRAARTPKVGRVCGPLEADSVTKRGYVEVVEGDSGPVVAERSSSPRPRPP
ncbi:hypothetical protein PG993_004374 [Apiospora rasikravindrae]|uniref:Uncharacterized protein n=1 Tax=Apiospora rasikravindrae TaxID=990691 RepID=A0ABR1TCL1_9PEZI